MKQFLPLFTILLLSASSTQAQERITISELLEQGYEIVAASGTDSSPYVFLQKRKSAFMCVTTARASRCFNLNGH